MLAAGAGGRCQTTAGALGGTALILGVSERGDALGTLAVRIGNGLSTSRHVAARLVDVDHVELLVTASDGQVQRRSSDWPAAASG